MMQEKKQQKVEGEKNPMPDTETGAGQVGNDVVDPMGRTMKGVKMGQGDGEGTGINAGTGGEQAETGGARPDKPAPQKS